MDQIRIVGGTPLSGSIAIGGAKNAALPLLTASLLTDEVLVLQNLPHLADITTMLHLLSQHGVHVGFDGCQPNGGAAGRVVNLRAADITSTTAPYDIVRKMRASVLVLGALLAREGQATVSLPGGCAIGTRPVNFHIDALVQMGAEIDIVDGYINAQAPRGLQGTVIRFPNVSVGATENLLMAASLARGTTVLENAAREPEVSDLAHCLVAMGAKIEGIDSDTLTIVGVDRLHGAEYAILPDRVETASYAIAAAITGGEITLKGARADLMEACVDALLRAGVEIHETQDGMTVSRRNGALEPVDITTQPFPGFPTDMQAQIMTLLSLADGTSVISETIFENRFMHVPELARMGADITIKGNNAVIRGVEQLKGAPVMATDLRASVSLVLAGLAAEGTSTISRVYHLDRGYELLEEKLQGCGAEIERLKS